MFKKLFISLFFIPFLFANDYIFVGKNIIYVNKESINKYYKEKLTLEETKFLINIIKKMLNNEKFLRYTEHIEMGKSKVYTKNLLKSLLNYLRGKKQYTNTYFNNNGPKAGIKGILEDNIKNNININLNVKDNIDKSISNNMFFKKSDEIIKKLKNISWNNTKKIINDFNLLFNQYVLDIQKLRYIELLNNFDKNIQNVLLEKYRIETKTSLINALKIFKKYFNLNNKLY